MPRLLAGLLLVALFAAPAGAFNFCDPYGVACYKPPRTDVSQCPFLHIGEPDGDYMGSVYLTEGQCGVFSCSPCDDTVREVDFDALCNARFAECQGECFSE